MKIIVYIVGLSLFISGLLTASDQSIRFGCAPDEHGVHVEHSLPLAVAQNIGIFKGVLDEDTVPEDTVLINLREDIFTLLFEPEDGYFAQCSVQEGCENAAVAHDLVERALNEQVVLLAGAANYLNLPELYKRAMSNVLGSPHAHLGAIKTEDGSYSVHARGNPSIIVPCELWSNLERVSRHNISCGVLDPRNEQEGFGGSYRNYCMNADGQRLFMQKVAVPLCGARNFVIDCVTISKDLVRLHKQAEVGNIACHPSEQQVISEGFNIHRCAWNQINGRTVAYTKSPTAVECLLDVVDYASKTIFRSWNLEKGQICNSLRFSATDEHLLIANVILSPTTWMRDRRSKLQIFDIRAKGSASHRIRTPVLALCEGYMHGNGVYAAQNDRVQKFDMRMLNNGEVLAFGSGVLSQGNLLNSNGTNFLTFTKDANNMYTALLYDTSSGSVVEEWKELFVAKCILHAQINTDGSLSIVYRDDQGQPVWLTLENAERIVQRLCDYDDARSSTTSTS